MKITSRSVRSGRLVSVHTKNKAVPLERLIRLAVMRERKKGITGAIVTFTGIVRKDDGVSFLEYESCRTEAERALKALASDVKREFGLNCVVIHHIIESRLRPGEEVLYVVVTSSHRRTAFAACKTLVDRMKREVPIWKKEHYVKDSKKKPKWVREKNIFD